MQCHIIDEGMTLMAANQKLPLGNTKSSKDSVPGSTENSILETPLGLKYTMKLLTCAVAVYKAK